MSSEYEKHDEVFYAGRPGQVRDDIQDFSVDNIDGMIRTRKLFIQDQGDAPDCGFGRMGPDNAPPPPEAVPPEDIPPGVNLGTWYWRAYTRAHGWLQRSAQIYCRLGIAHAGSLHFATAGPGGQNQDDAMRDRLVIESDGTIWFAGVPQDDTGRLQIRLPNGKRAWLRVELQ